MSPTENDKRAEANCHHPFGCSRRIIMAVRKFRTTSYADSMAIRLITLRKPKNIKSQNDP